MGTRMLEIRGKLANVYADVLTPEVLDALAALAPLDDDRKAVMAGRIARRTARALERRRITFLDPYGVIPRTQITVQDGKTKTDLTVSKFIIF